MNFLFVMPLLYTLCVNNVFANAFGQELSSDTLPKFGDELLQSQTYRIDKLYAIGTYDKVNWFTAQQICSARGMTLASLNNEKEAMDLQNYLIKNGLQNESFWLSGTNLSQLDNWFWFSSGRPISSYANWKPGEPNNYSNNEHCLAVLSFGYWNDLNCDNKLYFICENRCPLNSYDVPLLKK